MVELSELERIVPGGRISVRWYVQVGDGWSRVGQHPSARRTAIDAPPGVVWENRIELRVTRGTRFLRVSERPAPRRRRSAFEHLARETRSPDVRRQRLVYEFVGRGELKPLTGVTTPELPTSRDE